MSLKGKSILRAQQFDRELIEQVFLEAQVMRTLSVSRALDMLAGYVMLSLFYEPSTRTRLSFESAMLKLGGKILVTDHAREFSSAAKGETLEDTIRTVTQYGVDAIVLRHYQEGAAKAAAAVTTVPILNAGDGPGQHPTQALLDLFTISEHLGRVDGLDIAFVGDLKYGRTVHSLLYLLTKFRNITFYFVAPELVRMKPELLEYLREKGCKFVETENLEDVLPVVDVVYQTRIQKERFASQADYEATKGKYIFCKDTVERMPDHAILMHPLPRVDEIKVEVDTDHRAHYFKEVQNGWYVRMALLKMVLLG